MTQAEEIKALIDQIAGYDDIGRLKNFAPFIFLVDKLKEYREDLCGKVANSTKMEETFRYAAVLFAFDEIIRILSNTADEAAEIVKKYKENARIY